VVGMLEVLGIVFLLSGVIAAIGALFSLPESIAWLWALGVLISGATYGLLMLGVARLLRDSQRQIELLTRAAVGVAGGTAKAEPVLRLCPKCKQNKPRTTPGSPCWWCGTVLPASPSGGPAAP
jgi:hypothetical protein